MTTEILSLRETAERHDVSPGYLSKCVRAGKSAKGHDLCMYAVFDEEGTIDGFRFPPSYDFPRGGAGAGSQPEASAAAPPASSRAGRTGPSAQGAAHSSGQGVAGREAAIDRALAEADELELPDRGDWLSIYDVYDLFVEHLRVPNDKFFGAAVPALEELVAVDGHYRRDRVERFIKLVGQYGVERAADRIRKARAVHASASSGEASLQEHEWMDQEEAYDLIVSHRFDIPVGKDGLIAAMYTLLQPAQEGPGSRGYFRRDHVAHFIGLIAEHGYDGAVVELSKCSDG